MFELAKELTATDKELLLDDPYEICAVNIINKCLFLLKLATSFHD